MTTTRIDGAATMARWIRACGWPLALLGLGVAAPARAAVDVQVDPDTVAVGQPVAVFGSSDCEGITLDFGDGSATETFAGPGAYATTHVYTAPGVVQVLALGTACADGIDSQVSTVVVTPGGGGPVTPPPGPGGPGTPPLGPSIGSLFIERLGLRFDNNRPEFRVLQNQKGVQIFADVQFAGTGLLQGYWEVDGVLWSFVNRHLVFGNNVTIASPAIPGLPTIDPGIHRVRFVLLRPTPGFTPPAALYFAGYEEADALLTLRLMQPVREARMSYEDQRFEWASSEHVAAYRVSFFDVESRELVFSAFTRSADYRLLARVIEPRFEPGRHYEWQVAAYGPEGEELANSRRRAFAFDPPSERVEGQAIVVTSPPAARIE
jgi:hypothetical protein